MKNLTSFFCLVFFMASTVSAATHASVYIISPSDGDVVTNPVTIKFGVKGMGVAPAGVDIAETGHHHLLLDVDNLPDLTKPIPADAHHMHFGKGQTEVELTLSPGKHTLQLLFGNYLHIPHQPPLVSNKIEIEVK